MHRQYYAAFLFPSKLLISTLFQIPSSQKSTSCHHALSFYEGVHQVWAETKYDGERAQIHVEIQKGGGSPRITIFSKSKRDSTYDRWGVRQVVIEALGLSDNATRDIAENVILEAEMVAMHGDKIDGVQFASFGADAALANVVIKNSGAYVG